MNTTDDPLPIRIAVVGPCSSGKSTLSVALRAAGYEVRNPAQEHSYVQSMWQQMTHPDLLIYLDLTYDETRQRRPHHDGGHQRLAEQHERLRHARQHADFYLDTTGLSIDDVRDRVFEYLGE